MSGKQILRSEVVLEKYGKSLVGKTGTVISVHKLQNLSPYKNLSYSSYHWSFGRIHCRGTRHSTFRRRPEDAHPQRPIRI